MRMNEAMKVLNECKEDGPRWIPEALQLRGQKDTGDSAKENRKEWPLK